MRKDLINDARIAVGVFVDMRRARAEGKDVRLKMVRCCPCIKSGPAFYDISEGCMFTHRDRALHNAVWEVFKTLSYEDKRVLCFPPENGRFLARVQLWERELEPALPPKLYHKAMGAILHQYVRIKLAHVRGRCRMPLRDIKIYPCFWETPPSPGKMDEKRQYLKDHGTFQSDIVLDEDGYLIDGFTSYLLARERGIIDVPVRYGKRQVIQAYHRPGGKLYTWELPEGLTGQVSAGDEVVVHTQRGVRCVTVAAVRRYVPRSSAGRMQMVIKRKGGPA